MQGKSGGHLRRGNRWGTPVGAPPVRISRLVLGVVIATVLVALLPGLASAQPSPDPYTSGTARQPAPAAKPRSLAPDPAPSASRSAPPAPTSSSQEPAWQPPSPPPAPATQPPAQPAKTVKTVKTTEPRPVRTSPPPPLGMIRIGPSGPLTLVHLPTAAERPRLAVPSTDDAGPVLLAALALLALALASGSFVHLAARTDGVWRKA